MGIWSESLEDFRNQCRRMDNCLYCALCDYDCCKFKATLEKLAQNEKIMEERDNDEKQ